MGIIFFFPRFAIKPMVEDLGIYKIHRLNHGYLFKLGPYLKHFLAQLNLT